MTAVEQRESAWRRFWFASEDPTNLAAARVVFAAHALWLVLSRDFAGVSALPSALWANVPATARGRYLLFPGHGRLESTVTAIAVVALVCALVGLHARLACFVSSLALYHLAPLETIILTPSPWLKGLTLSVPALLILSLSPCADALAVGKRRRLAADPSEYAWPLHLVQLLVAQMYLFGGYSKLFQSGWSWAGGPNMQAWLLLANQDPEQAVITVPGLWVARQPWLYGLMGVLALSLELSFVAVLFSRRARRWLVPAAAVLHVVILLTMNYVFLNLPQLLVFVDWSALRARATGLTARVPRG